jgi:hypothetical protein
MLKSALMRTQKFINIPTVLTLAFSLIYYLIQHPIEQFALEYAIGQVGSVDVWYFYRVVLELLKFLLSPVLLFVVSYFVGKRIWLRSKISLVILLPFLGSLVGPVVWYGHYYLLEGKVIDYIFMLSVIYEGMEIFVVSFTAMTIAHLKRERIAHGTEETELLRLKLTHFATVTFIFFAVLCFSIFLLSLAQSVLLSFGKSFQVFLVHPPLLFWVSYLVSYLVGKNIKLRSRFPSVIISLLLCSMTLAVYGYISLSVSIPVDYPISLILAYNTLGWLSEGLQMFFIVFTAMAIAYLRNEQNFLATSSTSPLRIVS